ncbi:DUF397 domain-containing protein [Amycolatopsis sp. H20-H5]|uniref:DUF397 domain-containing protein n=1 Tax=Amycolatopsis sp. H20-H5 TaxID=3046309 RepID=UPI002DBAABD6|nr:DUF397 domain-containing protein [Amycolatopsis sp. H20-H5]MEC3977753.1 DUF397 domain-containing protein [Amycolatopsis sp. H20-H5]
MKNIDVHSLSWRKSSYSGEDPNKTNCVEIAFAGGHAFVRDSKDPSGGMFPVTGTGWANLVRLVETDEVG